MTGTYTNPLEAIWQSMFNVVSLSSSTGMATVDTSVWPAFCVLILLFLSIQCGCSGSTTGGLKADRVWLLLSAVRAQIVRTIHPNAVVRVKVGNTVADVEQVNAVATYTILYFVILFVLAIFYAGCGMDLEDSFTASCAMVGNVGPAFGSVGSLENYAAVPVIAKIVMGLEMIVGRLGLYAVFGVFAIRRQK